MMAADVAIRPLEAAVERTVLAHASAPEDVSFVRCVGCDLTHLAPTEHAAHVGQEVRGVTAVYLMALRGLVASWRDMSTPSAWNCDWLDGFCAALDSQAKALAFVLEDL